MDLDKCASPAALRAKLAADEHIQAAFVSPTGRGIKALVRIQADASCHLASFRGARKYFAQSFGLAVDEACKDVSRLCFASYDPDLFVREEPAKPIAPIEQEEAPFPAREETPESGRRRHRRQKQRLR